MKKIMALLFVIGLTGCSSTMMAPGPKQSWPDTPPDLKIACDDLALVDENTAQLSEVLKVVTANYSQYYTCKDKVDNWLEWYATQQKIYNSVK
jgi:hypothetical protein